jgi:hypothetical protein
MTISLWRSALGRLVIGCIAILTCAPFSSADSYTQTELRVRVDTPCVASDGLMLTAPIIGPVCRRTTASSAWVVYDNSTTTWLGISQATTTATYGTNQVSIDLNQKRVGGMFSTPHLALIR